MAGSQDSDHPGSVDVFSGDLCVEASDASRCPALTSLLSLLEKGSALLWTADRESRVVAITGGGAGVGPLDCAARAVPELFSAMGSRLTPIQAHDHALAGIAADFEAVVNGRDLSAHVEPLRGDAGEVLGVIGIAIDNTERLVADRAVRLSEQNYRSLVEEAPYAICRTTQSGRMLQVNRAMLDMLRYTRAGEADLLTRDLPFIFADGGDFAVLQAQLLENESIRGLESTWVCRDGHRIDVRLGGRAIRNLSGAVLCFDLLAEDVTEKKLLESRLHQAEKMQAVGQLAGGVAHDFNNLLTVIGGQIEVVLARTSDRDLRARLEDARTAAVRAAALTAQLLAFSRRQVLQSKPVDLNALIEHLRHMLHRLIREDITLTFHPGRNLGLVSADANQLEQIFINLVVNAQDAMPQGGQLTIQTTTIRVGDEHSSTTMLEPGVYVLTSVRDTGIGMDPGTQARIFEPFFTTKKIGEGTGLGLSMAYGVIKQSGGDIQVESQPGKGSTFKIYLPQLVGSSVVANAPAPEYSPRGCETVLLAEDEESVRNLVAEHLRSLGYEVLSASDGAVAVELARSHLGRIDLLLSDLVMPKMGGRDLARVLRGDRSRLKVIFVSGHATHSSAGQKLDPSTAHFLPKPFSMHQLAQTVREVLDKPESKG